MGIDKNRISRERVEQVVWGAFNLDLIDKYAESSVKINQTLFLLSKCQIATENHA
jgi:hypothetical protein